MPDARRTPKRVTWKPNPDATPSQNDAEPRIDLEPERTQNNDSNDERLKADKPPHWG